MSSRRTWLEVPCPHCGAAVGARCCEWRWGLRSRAAQATPFARLHIARGWRGRGCPTLKAPPGESCTTPSGREASHIHAGRLRPGRYELFGRDGVCAELESRRAALGVVPFSGRAGRGGETERIRLSRPVGDDLIDVGPWTGCDELENALAVPVWDRYGSFQGQPWIRGDVIWTLEDKRVVTAGTRGNARFEELVR